MLDLADEKGSLCSRILADLGAEVIKVEAPGGDPARRLGPFYQGEASPDGSLSWWFNNANKKGITLNIQAGPGRNIFTRLVRTAHFIVESFPPGYLTQLGLGYRHLQDINPAVILTSVTPYGQEGPYRDFQASDLTLMAMGGQVYVTGDPDRPPVRISVPQAYVHACAEGAATTMVAHCHRQRTGQGQQVDVSIQQSVVILLPWAIPWLESSGIVLRRTGALRGGLAAKVTMRQIWQCQDGYIMFMILGGAFGVKNNRGVVAWMKEDGFSDDFLTNFDWSTYDMATATQQIHDKLEEPIGRFFLGHTKAKLYEGAIRRGIMLYPVASVKEIVDNQQLRERDFWVPIEHPELGRRFTYPGAFVKIAGADCGPRSRSPLVGEHNYQIYHGEMGIPDEEIGHLQREGII